MDFSSHFRGKRITVMGLGLLGRSLGDARFLAEQGAELIVTDLKTREDLQSSVEALSGFPNITFVLGGHRLEDFRGRDYVLKSAGVPLESPYIKEAEKEGTPIKMSASWFMELAQIPVIGVTGTRGKSSVTHMLENILKKAGKKVLLGGNVRGVSTLSLLNDVTPDALALFELDSWQLQGFGDAKMSPNLSIFTTFYPDHLVYYGNDIDAYLDDKAQIFLYQKPEDTLVLGEQMATTVIEKYGEQIESHIVIASEDLVPKDWELVVPGEHNRYNAGLALAAARALNITDDVSREGLETFLGVPGRLELVALKNGISFYNDTNSTTPEATIAALHALGHEGDKRVLLIMGGYDKGLDMKGLLAIIPETAKCVALLKGSGTDRIKAEVDAPVFDSLEEALKGVLEYAEAGDTVLFSPAFASFGMFKNEYDRGDQFNALVSKL